MKSHILTVCLVNLLYPSKRVWHPPTATTISVVNTLSSRARFFCSQILVPMHLSNKNIRQPNLSPKKSIKIVQIGLGSNCWNQVCQLEAMRYKKTQKDNEFRWNKNRQTVPAPFCLMRQIWENPIQDWRLFRIISWHGCKNCWQHKLATNPPKVSRVILNKQHLFKKCLKFIGKLL